MSLYYQLMHRDLPLITFEVQPAAPASCKLESHYQVLACAEDGLPFFPPCFKRLWQQDRLDLDFSQQLRVWLDKRAHLLHRHGNEVLRAAGSGDPDFLLNLYLPSLTDNLWLKHADDPISFAELSSCSLQSAEDAVSGAMLLTGLFRADYPCSRAGPSLTLTGTQQNAGLR